MDEIVEQPNSKKELATLLDGIELPEEELTKIRNKLAGEAFSTEVLSKVIPVWSGLQCLKNWEKIIQADVEETKKDYLLLNTVRELKKHGRSISSLLDFISHPTNGILYSRLLQIAEVNEVNSDLILLLANSLQKLTKEDCFKKMDYNLCLVNVMSKLQSYSLLLLAQSNQWGDFQLGKTVYGYNGEYYEIEWHNEFAASYSRKHSLDSKQELVIAQGMLELQKQGLVQAKGRNGHSVSSAFLTELGHGVYELISQT